MAITRRQFVTRLGALAAAVGMSQSRVSKIAETFAYSADGTDLGGTLGKPRVVWIHGAECTGCSTSLLGIFEDANGIAVEGTDVTTGAAAGLARILPTQLGGNNFTYHALGYNVEGLRRHKHRRCRCRRDRSPVPRDRHGHGWRPRRSVAAGLHDLSLEHGQPFVLVVEGALQDHLGGGAWGDDSDTDVPWCSIGMSADGNHRARHGRDGRRARNQGQLRCDHPDRSVRHLRWLSGLQASDLRGGCRLRPARSRRRAPWARTTTSSPTATPLRPARSSTFPGAPPTRGGSC